MKNKKQHFDDVYRYIESLKDEEGYAVLNVNLQDKSELYNPLSYNDTKDLNESIYSYIDNETAVIPPSIPLRIKFHGNIEEKEQDEVRAIMKRHYTLKLRETMLEMASNTKKMLFLAIFGVVMLAFYFYFAFSTENVFWSEILSIIGSFALWESVDAFLLQRPALKREYRNIEQNLNQLIEFETK